MAGPANNSRRLRAFYDKLFTAFGPQQWWPAETRDEVIIGAVLTQNTAWTNVERAIVNLKAASVMTVRDVHELDVDALAELVKPAGTFRVKARRLKALADWIDRNYGCELDLMFRADPMTLRESLLSVAGVGPETADAILLYAGGVATFVVDAYTQRILRRHFLVEPGASYDQTKTICESSLPKDARVYNECHALLVELGKRFCRPTARCDQCPLRLWEHDAER